jgi:hypothetical protein
VTPSRPLGQRHGISDAPQNFGYDRPPPHHRSVWQPCLSNGASCVELYYTGRISAEGFGEEEGRITSEIAAAREAAAGHRQEATERGQLLERFEEVAAMLRDLNLDFVWDEATDQERRVLVEELVDRVVLFPDHLEVTIAGAPRLNVTFAEVGLSGRKSDFVGVGGGTCTLHLHPVVIDCEWQELGRSA